MTLELAKEQQMIYYEYDSEGFLVGWHEDDQRSNSTVIPYGAIPPSRAKWDGIQWVEDTTKEAAVALAQLRLVAASLVQKALDDLAKSWNYDSMLSLVSYRDSSVVKFQTEAAAGATWRDAMWAYAESSTAATLEDFAANFPTSPVQP